MRTVDRTRYEWLADELGRRIALGELRGRRRLPSEPQLAREFGMSRETVRSAMQILQKRGLVVRRKGVGTFIAGHDVQPSVTLVAPFYDALLARGLDPETRLLDFRLTRFDPEHAALFGEDAGMVLVRQYLVDGVPIAYARAHLPRAATALSWRDVEANQVILLVERYLGGEIARADLTIRAGSATEDDGRLLAVPEGAPVLVMQRTSFDTAGHALERTRCVLRPQTYEFTLSIAGPVSITDGFRRPVPSRPTP